MNLTENDSLSLQYTIFASETVYRHGRVFSLTLFHKAGSDPEGLNSRRESVH